MKTKTTFKLVLSKSDRDAIDWVGHRYSHGNELSDLLMSGECAVDGDDYENDPWHLPGEMTFEIPDNHMSEYERLITEDSMACFSGSLKHKLMTPVQHWLSGR